MEENINEDLRLLIYGSIISPVEVFNQFLDILNSIELQYIAQAHLRTRNKDNKILTSGGRNYFTFVERSEKEKPDVLFAGTLEKGPRNNKTPVIRVLESNPILSKIQPLFKFPFEGERSPAWTNVIISVATMELIKELLETEVSNYFLKTRR